MRFLLMSVLNTIADLHKEFQPLFHGEPVSHLDLVADPHTAISEPVGEFRNMWGRSRELRVVL